MREWWVPGLSFSTLFVLHHDVWNWHSNARVLGLPAGFAYHIAYCLLVTVVLVWLVRRLIPAGSSKEPGA